LPDRKITMKGQPFKRLIALYAAVNALASQAVINQPALDEAKKNLFNYRSRGKGKGKTQSAPKHLHMSLVRAAKKRRNVAKRSKK
jgi:hypothetical protein